MPHHDGDLRRNRSGEDKGLFVFIAIRSHALNEERKKKKRMSRPGPGPGPYQHRGAARRRAVQPSGARFPCDYRRQAHRWH